MDQVTVLGITGSIGGAFADACLRQGITVRALARDPSRVRPRAGLTLLRGDARDPDALQRAMEGSDVVLHGLNVPYTQWDPALRELTTTVLRAAERQGATVLFPGNVYGLGPDFTEPLDEDAPREAPSRKGQLRNDLEAQLEASETQTLVLRMGDFFGGTGQNTWMHHLTASARTGGALRYGGPLDVLHSWAYLPDAGATLLALAHRHDDLPRHAVFHFTGHVVDGHTWLLAAREALGDPRRAHRLLPWAWMQLARPFMPMVREMFEVRYLWQEPVRMRQDRLEALLGEVPHTPFAQAMGATLGSGHAVAARAAS